MAVPRAMAVTVPVELTVAIAALLLPQEPPVTVEANVAVLPGQYALRPDIVPAVAGGAVTVMAVVTMLVPHAPVTV